MSEGRCRCGKVRLRADGAPLVTMACHCRGCQKMSASAFSLSSLYPVERFVILEGEPTRGGMKTGPSHMFCGSCMTWLYTVPEGLEAFANVRSSMFEDSQEHRPFIETFRVEGLPWVTAGAERSYDGVPSDEEFGPLIAAYADWDGRVKR